MNLLIPMSEPEARLVVVCLRGISLLLTATNVEATNQCAGLPGDTLKEMRTLASALAPALAERIDNMLDRRVES